MKILNMKKITHCLKVAFVTAVLLLPIKEGIAQEQAIRSGSAGASELLITVKESKIRSCRSFYGRVMPLDKKIIQK